MNPTPLAQSLMSALEASSIQTVALAVSPSAQQAPEVVEICQRLEMAGARCLRLEGEVDDPAAALGALAQRADRLLAIGGDGTIHLALQALWPLESPPPLGVLPMGTGNDLARALEIPNVLSEALVHQLQAQPSLVDVGLCNGVPFLNVASGGPTTDMTQDVDDGLKDLLGGVAYTLRGLWQLVKGLDPVQVEITTEAGPFWSGQAVGLCVGNGAYAGGGRHVAPHALLDDGLLDVMVIPWPEDLSGWSSALADAVRPAWDANFEMLTYGQHQTARMITDREIAFNLDGEPIRGERFEFSVQPKRLALCLPHPHPMLRQG